MSHAVDLKKLEQRAHREYQQDGLMEVLLGALLLLAAVIFRHPYLIFLYALYVLFGTRILERAKRRFTYPRIGRVKLYEEAPKSLAKGIFAFMLVVVAVIALGLLLFGDIKDTDLWYKWCPAFVGCMMVGAFTYLRGKSGSVRHAVYAAVAGMGGIGASLLDFESTKANLVVYLIAMGGLFVLTGAGTLTWFVRTHPVVTQEVPGDDHQR